MENCENTSKSIFGLNELQKETLELLRSTTGVERDYLWRIVKGCDLDFGDDDKEKVNNCLERPKIEELKGEAKLKKDIEDNKGICPMVKCIWRLENGKCKNNGITDMLEVCKEKSFVFYEESKNG